MSSSETLHFTDDDFDAEVLQADEPVLVDFWAPWCGPCRVVGPVVDQLARDLRGRVKVGKMNVDEQSLVPARYQVRSIPTLLVFRGGKVVEQIVGAVPRARIEAVLTPHLDHDAGAA